MEVMICVEKLNGHDKTGKLGKVCVNVGDIVNVGDVLFSLESEKGSISSKSSHSGKVKEIVAGTGDILSKGDGVLVLEGAKSESVSKEKKKTYSFGLAKPKNETFDIDVAVLGGGPGGYVAAIRLSQLGKSVVLIEEDRLGGTCLNYGCIPTKALAHSTKVLKHIKNGEHYGFLVDSPAINVDRMIERKNEVVDTLVGGIEHLMESNGVRIINGTGKITSPNSISVSNKKVDATINFENLIIATGSEVSYIDIEGHDLESVMTSKSALDIKTIPKSITIIGGGVIGMEFAFIFNALGSEVHVIEYTSQVLSLLDQDVVDVVKASAQEKGISIQTGACAAGIYETENNMMMTSYQIGEKLHYIATEKVMMAVGRKARIENLNLENIGVSLNEKSSGIKVDSNMRTTCKHIYAIGDVTNIIQLAHVASHQGLVAAENIAGNNEKMHYDLIPSAIFTSPEIGHVGMTEKEAKLKNVAIQVTKFPFLANGKSVAMNDTEGFVKILTDTQSKTILGASIVGSNGTDMIATLTHLISNKTTLDDAIKAIYAHPTAAEAVSEVLLGALGRGLHNA